MQDVHWTKNWNHWFCHHSLVRRIRKLHLGHSFQGWQFGIKKLASTCPTHCPYSKDTWLYNSVSDFWWSHAWWHSRCQWLSRRCYQALLSSYMYFRGESPRTVAKEGKGEGMGVKCGCFPMCWRHPFLWTLMKEATHSNLHVCRHTSISLYVWPVPWRGPPFAILCFDCIHSQRLH